MTQRRFITVVAEDTPYVHEVVTQWERHLELHEVTSLECIVCDTKSIRLITRGYLYELENGFVMCLHCLFDSNTQWELIAPNAMEAELVRSETSKHSRKNF